MQLSLSTIHFSPMFGGDVGLPTFLDAAAAAGWRSVGIDDATVAASRAAGDDDVATLLSERGLVCTDVLALAITSDRADNVARTDHLRELARNSGARICVAAFTGRPDAALLEECAELLHSAGIRIALEFLPYSPVADPSMAFQICESVGFERAGLLVDSWHVFVGGHLDACTRLTADAITMVQFSDGFTVGSAVDVREASRHHRLLPGSGEFALHAFVEAVRATGFDGVVAPEVLSRDLRVTPPDVVAASLLDASTTLWKV